MTTAAAYIRVSTEEQAEFSPDSQLKRILDYAAAHDMEVPERYIFTDEGISGRTVSKRPAFQRMIALAKNENTFEKILVWKFSRFARNRQDSIFYKSMLRKECGVEVLSVTEPLSHDPTSILIEALLEAMDEYYSINLAQEVRRGLQERFSRGRAVSVPPFGYRMGTDSFERQPEEARWVFYIFHAYAGGASPQEISRSLNEARVRTTRGNAFQPRSVSYILLNPVYIGLLRKRKGEPVSCDRFYTRTDMDYVRGRHTPLIPEALWNAVQTRWRTEHPSSAAPPFFPSPAAADSSYYLRGRVRCADCGSHLIHVQKDAAFQCSGYNHGRCRSHYIRRLDLEALVLSAAAPYLPPAALACLSDARLPSAERNAILLTYHMEFLYCAGSSTEPRQTRLIRSDLF